MSNTGPAIPDLEQIDGFMLRQLLESATDDESRRELRQLCTDAVTTVSQRLAELAAGAEMPAPGALARELHGMKGMLACVGLSGLAGGLAAMEATLARDRAVPREQFRRLHDALGPVGGRLLARL
ncbi:MAG: Hpt domain-containing protein [Opitutaceae bacterium]|nr:Hpt domain-containing protein [Opitutaceae bacterium]